MVHHAAQAKRALAALLLAAAALGGCGGGGSKTTQTATTASVPPEPAQTPGNPNLGDARLADCAAWRRGDVGARYGTIRDIRSFAGSPTGTPGYRGATLPDAAAYRLFEGWCSHGYATYFKLYKLYTRAAAFTPHR